MITLYFVRHGETEWNRVGRYQGSTNVPLSETGLRQADITADYLADFSFDGIFTSPLDRARITAEKIAEKHHMEPVVMPDLSELCFGEWEGKTFDEINSLWPGQIDELYDHPDRLLIPGGETFQQLENRTMNAISDILDRGDDHTWLIVSHGASIRSMLCGLLEIPIAHAWNFRQSNVNLTCVQHMGPGRNWLKLLNDTCHLKEYGL